MLISCTISFVKTRSFRVTECLNLDTEANLGLRNVGTKQSEKKRGKQSNSPFLWLSSNYLF